MSTAKYSFLSWVRQGLANKIIPPQQNQQPVLERVSVEAVVTITNLQSTIDIPKTLKLVGPGDVLGINKDVFLNFQPSDGSYDFDYNSLAYVDFYDADFPWRYTPDLPDSNNHRLMPWLLLVVLKDSEFDILPPVADGLPLILKITATNLSNILHNNLEHWAWAHAQQNVPNSNIVQDRDGSVSRLLCPRRLEANTQYTAFLVPAFETGRQAGLGLATDQTIAAKQSWNYDGTTYTIGLGTSSVNQFPFYKKWRFGTAAEGDFETLVRRIKPYTILGSLSGRKLDITRTGMGFPSSLFNNQGVPKTVEIEGALKPPSVTLPQKQNIGYTTGNVYLPYTDKLKELINFSNRFQQQPSQPVDNPYVIGKKYYQATTVQGNDHDDPVVLPPMYGQWHADKKVIDSNTPLWFQEVNLDIRYRAVAGLGAEVIRKNQEYYMEIAWKQVGEIMIANSKMAKLKMAREASNAIFSKHLVGDVKKPNVSNEDRLNTLVKVGSLGFKKFNTRNSGIPGTAGVNPPVRVSATTAARMSYITKAGSDSGFRKISRSGSLAVKRVNKNANTDINQRIVTKLNTDNIRAAKSRIDNLPLSEYTTTDAILVDTVQINTSLTSNSNWSGYMTSSQAIDWARIYLQSFNLLHATLMEYQLRENTYFDMYEPIPLDYSATSGNFVTDILNGLDPQQTISTRGEYQSTTTTNNTSQNPPVGEILAYPVIDIPMLEELVKISPEYLLPDVGQYPNNSLTLLEPNKQFIEAYMVGLNHEFSKELLWHEYPTDQRGTYFKRFWNIGDSSNSTPNPDIIPLHTWNSGLGLNMGGGTLLGSLGSNFLILLIRADLLQKYPDPLIYAQKAAMSGNTTGPQHILAPGGSDPANINTLRKYPVFKMTADPNIVMLAFPLTKQEALGNDTTASPGWFFVFQERPGQLRFGLDQATTAIPNYQNFSWNDLRWNEFGNNVTVLTANPQVFPSQLQTHNNTANPKWGSNAANTAAILYQRPIIIAVHASDMLQ